MAGFADKGLQKRISEVNPGERSHVKRPGEGPVRKSQTGERSEGSSKLFS